MARGLTDALLGCPGAVPSGRASGAPKDDTVAGIRALHNAARSAVKARTAAQKEITNLLVTAPEAFGDVLDHPVGH
ncbi:hypothetical protein ABZZ36_41635 [Actinacidiphila glaucinigra]|uniref:hypothetical protein n=1 Tax=Actinacidiphila glaucinigra TaxID=235986 RepID=UPI0033BB6A73